jgi:mevalonate kinase
MEVGLDPLNSYLSIPILINLKTTLKLLNPNQSFDGKGAVFYRFRNCGRNCSMVNIYGEPKRQRFSNDVEKSFVKYTDLCVENFLGGDMKSLFLNTKKLSKVV